MAKASPSAAKSLTRDCLTEALVRLCRQKPLAEVTVTELCRTAGVSRMAFYRNYASKEEVLLERLDELIAFYRRTVAPFAAAGAPCYATENLTVAFHFFREHRELVECFYRSGLSERFEQAVTASVVDTWGDGSRPRELALTAFAGSLCALLGPWAAGGYAETPRQMAALLHGLYARGPRVLG